MILFATSDKGGTGRSVTSCNLAYRLTLRGRNVAYVDFDFGSPTAGALFEIGAVERGISDNKGIHSYLRGDNAIPARFDVRQSSDRIELRARGRTRTGKLVLFPGDEGGTEPMSRDDQAVKRCVALLQGMYQNEFDTVIVDLSAGRSAALELALKATAKPPLSQKEVHWLVFHRWTRQHIIAANGLVHGTNGILETGVAAGHKQSELAHNIRYVRTAVPSVNDLTRAATPAQAAWLHEQNSQLKRWASDFRLGATNLLGETPVEPMLQWREQVILDSDVAKEIANRSTAASFEGLASRLIDPATWEPAD